MEMTPIIKAHKAITREMKYTKTMRLRDIFIVRRIKRTIHGGMGYELGDGVDIEDEVLQFGRNEGWLKITLSVHVVSTKNEYHFDCLRGRYQWIKK